MRSKLLLGLAFVGALLWIAGAVHASSSPRDPAPPPGAVLDQSNPKRDPPCNVRGWLPDDSSSWAAQSFTAGITGHLTDVVLPLKGTNSGSR